MGAMRTLGAISRISELAEQNKIAAYNYPQGVLTLRARSAAHQPGILSDIGIGTFVDPRQQGGKLNDVTKEDLIKLVEIDNKEYLYYKAIAPNVALSAPPPATAKAMHHLKMR